MKIICIGRNYAKHAAELKNEVPSEPVVFCKPDSAVLPPRHPFVIPHFSDDIHYEVEVLVKITRNGKCIEPQFAHKYYEEIGLGIDFTARDLQAKLKQKGLPWEKAKGFDGSAVIGKWLPKTDFQLEGFNFSLHNNDKVLQQGNTSDMLFSIDQIISHVSHYFMLKLGDVIFTGTPEGVGKVKSGDLLIGKVEGQENFRVNIR